MTQERRRPTTQPVCWYVELMVDEGPGRSRTRIISQPDVKHHQPPSLCCTTLGTGWPTGPVLVGRRTCVGGTPAWATLTDTNTQIVQVCPWQWQWVGREGGGGADREGGTTYNMPSEPVKHITNISTHNIYSPILILLI